MALFKDLTGQKFNHLTVIKLDEEKSNTKKKYWICRCDCENHTIKSIRGDQLTSGKTKSCGCYNRKAASERMKAISKNNTIKTDLTGQTFGNWFVESRAQNKNNHVAWNCICKCGERRVVLGQSLKNGTSQSCGCLNMSHGEQKINNILLKNNISFEKEYVIQDLFFNTKNNKARFDFYVNNYYAIQYDGEQHFKETNNSFFKEDLNTIKKHDQLKNNYCKEHNIPLIRIPYTHYNNIVLEDLLLETSKFRVN